MTEDQIKLAAKVVKILRLARDPGHDRVSIMLNSQPTYDEVEAARHWAKAFELAQRGGNAMELAAELHQVAT